MKDLHDLQAQALFSIMYKSTQVRREEISQRLAEVTGRRVQSGLFAGMELADEASWGDSDFAPKVLGCYEEELKDAIVKACLRQPKTIVNVGCAEGYYAVGLARLLPEARVFASDIHEAALRICLRNAERNGAGGRVLVGGELTVDLLESILRDSPAPHLLVMDCEGAELALIDPAQAPSLAGCDIIVECHDFLNRDITPTLLERLSTTHDIERIDEGARNPNRYPALRSASSLDRWLAVCENRPECMHWLACFSRGR